MNKTAGLKQRIQKIYKFFVDQNRYSLYARQYKRYLNENHFDDKKKDGEDEYDAKWRVFGQRVEPYSYRFFSNYMSPCPEIVPEHIAVSFIQPILDPDDMKGPYIDKNMFPVICGKNNVPKTLLCRIDGGQILDDNFLPLHCTIEEVLCNEEQVILKPSKNSCGGRDVTLFKQMGGGNMISTKGIYLTLDFLKEYGNDFVIQQTIKQHSGLSIFNHSSVNTIRMAVYKSWKDEEPHVCACVLRIGKCGEFVDNASSGGAFVGVDVKSGKVGDKLFDIYGHSRSNWNGIDYSETRFIPFWEEAKRFACDIARKVVHHRWLSMDITINSDGHPQLIEYNLSIACKLFMYTGQKPFGDYTDEIIEYCKNRY